MTTSPEEQVELHGHGYTPFWGFDEETIYMERESNDQRREARRRMWDQAGKDADLPEVAIDPQPIFMRWVTGDEADDPRREDDAYWQECAEDHPDAVRFWKAAA